MTRVPAAQTLQHTISALVIVGAIATSLFFNGQRAEYYALSMGLIVAWAGWVIWRGLRSKRWRADALLLSLLAFQGWLLATLAWNPAPYLGAGYFWLLSTPLIAVLAWNVAAEPERQWPPIRALLVAMGLGLVMAGLYQLIHLGQRPTASFINPNSLAAMLNLLMFIAASAAIANPGARTQRYVLLACVAGMASIVGIIASRGALLGLFGGVLVVGLGGWWLTRSFRQIAPAILAIAIGIGTANLPVFDEYVDAAAGTESLADRMSTLSDPYSAGSDRFIIWTRSLDMAMARPLAGYGLGTYWQQWPQWRHPEDRSGGFWAHNDLLHLWIEAGLPAVVLLALVHLALLASVLRIVRNPLIDSPRRLETVVLFAGLTAVAIHAQFTFAYYTLPIILAMSLVIARIARTHQDIQRHEKADVPAAAARWIAAPAAVLLVAYFAATGVATVIYDRATETMRQGDQIAAERGFKLAQRLWPSTGIFYYTHAWMKIQELQGTPASEQERRQDLYREADGLVSRAIDNNPLRPLTHFIHGHLLVAAADIAGEDWLPRAEAAFAESIRLDPRYLDGRMTLARILAATGRHDEAYRVLQEGEHHWYPASDPKTQAYRHQLANQRIRNALPGAEND